LGLGRCLVTHGGLLLKAPVDLLLLLLQLVAKLLLRPLLLLLEEAQLPQLLPPGQRDHGERRGLIQHRQQANAMQSTCTVCIGEATYER